MKAEIISIGTELLLGEIVNTDASYIAGELPALGIDLYHIITVGDNKPRIIDAFTLASQRSDIIITTGGLGPTQDDITRESLAEFLHEEISINPDLVKQFEEFFARRNMAMSPSNRKQASVIPSAEVIPNKRGTAPGWWIQRNGKIFITLPGPTGELKDMWTYGILPRLKALDRDSIILSRTLKTFGLPESQVDDMIGHLLGSTNPTIGVYAKIDGIHLRITSKAASETEAKELITRRETEIRAILDEYIWGTDTETLEEVIQKLLLSKGLTIGTMESETGGILASALTNNTESNKYFRGGYITTTKEMKISLGIDAKILCQYDKICPEIAAEMAKRARELTKSDIGLAICADWEKLNTGRYGNGIACIGIDSGKHKFTFSSSFPGLPHQIKQRAVTTALSELRKIVINGVENAPHN